MPYGLRLAGDSPTYVRYVFRMDDSRFTVSKTELTRTLTVWIRAAPKRMWRDYWHHAETEGKWGGSADIVRFDPRQAMADYIAGKFDAANWEVTYPTPVHPSSGTPLANHQELAEQRRIDSDRGGG